MDVDFFHRTNTGAASEQAETALSVVRVETTTMSDDGQQFRLMMLDADDSFDFVVQWPDGEREIVWSLAREREGQS
jgi:hypothetical protein